MPACENISSPIQTPADIYLRMKALVGGFLTVLDKIL